MSSPQEGGITQSTHIIKNTDSLESPQVGSVTLAEIKQALLAVENDDDNPPLTPTECYNRIITLHFSKCIKLPVSRLVILDEVSMTRGRLDTLVKSTPEYSRYTWLIHLYDVVISTGVIFGVNGKDPTKEDTMTALVTKLGKSWEQMVETMR